MITAEDKSGKNRPYLALCLLLISLPYFYAFFTDRTFAPTTALRSTALPFAEGYTGAPPANHFWADTLTFYYPRFHSLQRKDFPISFSAGGSVPLYSDTISGFFSPINLLLFYFLPIHNHSLDILWLLQTLLYAAGIYLWLSRLGLPPAACALACLTQGFCTAFFPGSYMSFQTLGALAFLPWALWAEETKAKKWAPVFFLALGCYGGNIQTALFPLMAYGLWMLLRGEWWRGTLNGGGAVLLSLPLWVSGLEYHILMATNQIDKRLSELPPDTIGKLKALVALPALFLPELFGSSKSVDFLKAFKTSSTYFIGSIGLLGPLLAVLGWRRDLLKNKLAQFALVLLAFSLLVMATPLLNYLYYRILCLTCLGLSLLVAAVFASRPDFARRSHWLPVTAVAFVAAALAAAFVKHRYEAEITDFLRRELSRGTYAWWPGLAHARVDRWFRTYLSSLHAWLLPPLFLAAWFFARRKAHGALAATVVLECVLVWAAQVTLDPTMNPAALPAMRELKSLLQASPSFPVSRFQELNCGTGPFLFGFSLGEYTGTPKIYYYGSTDVPVLKTVNYHCEHETKTIPLEDPDTLRQTATNVLVVRTGWTPTGLDLTPVRRGKDFWYWVPTKGAARSAITPLEAADAKALETETISWDGSHLSLRVRAAKAVGEWTLSLPPYPGWTYRLDDKIISPVAAERNVPRFREPIAPGEHTLTASFNPRGLAVATLVSGLLALLLLAWGLAGQSRKTSPA